MSEKREYDAALGGDIVLGNHVQTYRYANAALQEIRELVAATKQPTGTKLIFQTLPKHIRRRAMSHHPKRLPRKYRSVHIAQMAKSGKQRILRRPSRKYRRRPSNLLQDYLRRQRRQIWLETHIWFARRFKIVERWGYRLPLASWDKTYKACYRATAEHCLMQDISFYNCLELRGTVSCLHEGFKCLSNNALTTSNKLSIKAVTFLHGQREGAIDLFRNGRFPEEALCRAMFMWRPIDAADAKDESLERTLWLWVHPSVHSIVLEELIKVFDLELIKKGEQPETEDNLGVALQDPNADTKRLEQRLRFMTKDQAHTRIKRYGNSKTGAKLIDLKDTLNRFRLTGPLSQSVLAHAFTPKKLCDQKHEEDNEAFHWFQELAVSEEFQRQHNDQVNYWRQCEFLRSPALVRPNMILALNIVDPRLQRPIKRTKARPENDGLSIEDCDGKKLNFLDLLVNVPKTLAQSPLWDENIRQELHRKMLSTHSWCLLRGKNALVPGAPCEFENLMQPVPVLLIQRPGLQDNHKRLSYGCGWDVIAPAGYGMPIWQTLIMWGAKAGGLRELQTLAREMGSEMHLPDTIGGRQMATDRYTVSYDKYFRLPPGKRHNYRKLAIASPFRAPWTQLLRDWLPENQVKNPPENKTQTFYIERDKTKLAYLNKLIYTILSAPKKAVYEINSNGLIQLTLRLKTRGNIGNNALICLPTCGDIKTQYKRKQQQSHSAVHIEPLQPDLNKQERKVVRLEHKKLLKRLRARRLREKRKLQETSTKCVRIRQANTAPLVHAHFERMCKLWLPDEDCSTYLSVRKQCSRETFGYVTEASFSFTNATVCAIGYVTFQGLQKLLKLFQSMRRGTPVCLLRDINSQHYYFADFEVSQNL